jgi:hypothetical protein
MGGASSVRSMTDPAFTSMLIARLGLLSGWMPARPSTKVDARSRTISFARPSARLQPSTSRRRHFRYSRNALQDGPFPGPAGSRTGGCCVVAADSLCNP